MISFYLAGRKISLDTLKLLVFCFLIAVVLLEVSTTLGHIVYDNNTPHTNTFIERFLLTMYTTWHTISIGASWLWANFNLCAQTHIYRQIDGKVLSDSLLFGLCSTTRLKSIESCVYLVKINFHCCDSTHIVVVWSDIVVWFLERISLTRVQPE